MLELETLFMLMNAVLYEYGPRFCVYEYCMTLENGQKHHLLAFLRKPSNFRTKIENF